MYYQQAVEEAKVKPNECTAATKSNEITAKAPELGCYAQ